MSNILFCQKLTVPPKLSTSLFDNSMRERLMTPAIWCT